MACVVGIGACTFAPEPPEAPRAVVQLSERYDQPTASLDERVVEQLFDESVPNYTELKIMAGLSFVRGVVAKALKVPELSEQADSLDVQGSLAIHTPCRGWDEDAEPRGDENGYVDLLIGVDESRAQRAFTGAVTRCRFVTKLEGQRSEVEASALLEVDLGRTLALGDPVPAILMRATQLSAELSVALELPESTEGAWGQLAAALIPDGLKLELESGDRPLSVRIADDDLVETLIDLGTSGTVLLGLRDDGRFNVRGSDGAWDCDSEGDLACVRSD